MALSYGLLHVNLNVSNLARSLQFYMDGLGFTMISEAKETVTFGSSPETLHQAILTVPSTHTILALTYAASLPVGPGGLNHLGLIVNDDEDVIELVKRVTTLGGTVQKQGRRAEGGKSETFAYVRDPDGYVIELSTQALLYAQFKKEIE